MLYSQYIKQVFAHFRSQLVLSCIQIIGSALAIFMTMLYVMMQDVQVTSIPPETHRDEYLHVYLVHETPKDTSQHWNNSGPLSTVTFRHCFKELKTPKAVACYNLIPIISNIGIAKGFKTSGFLKYCNDQFWQVFDFDFIEGRPFNEAESESGIRVVVLSKHLATQFFGKEPATGKDISINKMSYRVVGVVNDVSPLACIAFSDAWIPYCIAENGSCAWNSSKQRIGYFGAVIQAHSKDDFESIRQEIETNRQLFNESGDIGYMQIDFFDQPYNQETFMQFDLTSLSPDMDRIHRIYLLVIILLLVVPAINLSGMIQSRFRQRITEIGVRRAFGSSRLNIISQVFIENLILTIIAGLLGLILCFFLSKYGGQSLFESNLSSCITGGAISNLDISIFMHVSTFVYSFLFCFILNVLSSLFTAWKASRINITDALKKK